MAAANAVLVTDVLHFIGTSSAQALRDAGHRVFCQDEDFTDQDARTRFEAEHPGLTALAGQTGQDLVSELAGMGFTVDILVNNDAYPAERAPVDTAHPDDLRRTLDRLVVIPFERTGAVVPGMKDRGRGKIIFVTSAAPLRGLANYSMYATARGAANAMARSLAVELAPKNIQVNAVAPNFIESPTYFPPSLMENPDTAAKVLRNIPLGRLGRQSEAASLVVYLASDGADFLTGQVLPLAGGWA